MEHPCTIQVFKIAATDDTQVLKAAAPTGITRGPNMKIGSAGNFSRDSNEVRSRKSLNIHSVAFSKLLQLIYCLV